MRLSDVEYVLFIVGCECVCVCLHIYIYEFQNNKQIALLFPVVTFSVHVEHTLTQTLIPRTHIHAQ